MKKIQMKLARNGNMVIVSCMDEFDGLDEATEYEFINVSIENANNKMHQVLHNIPEYKKQAHGISIINIAADTVLKNEKFNFLVWLKNNPR